MQVLHSLWDTETLYIWAESSALPLCLAGKSGHRKRQNRPQPHPFALPVGELKDLLMNTVSWSGDCSRVEALSLRLPALISGPLPSPWLLREDYQSEKPSQLSAYSVPALGLAPGPALDLMLELPVHQPPGIAYADSMFFWSRLALFSLELVSREQFVPAIEKNRAVWKVVIDEPDQERLNFFIHSFPPSCLSLTTPGQATPNHLVHSYVNRAVNAIVLSSLDGVSLLPAKRGRRPKNVPLPNQFLSALTGQEPDLSASARELASFSSKLDSWTGQIHPKIEDVPFRTCFRLESPESEKAAWSLAFFLQANDDRSLLVPAKDVWKTKSQALTFLKKRMKNPQERLLADLGKASRIFPLMERCLENARPTCLDMQTEQAYSFLRESAPLLKQNGFGILLPTWWDKPGSRLGIKLRIKGAAKKEGKVGPGFFGLDSLISYDWQLSLGDNVLTEAEFQELSCLKIPLVQIRGEWMELSPTEIEAAIAFFQKNRDREMTLADALRLGNSISGQKVSDVDSTLPVLGVQAEGQIEQILKSLANPGSLEEIRPPNEFQGTLRPYQLRGVSWLEYLRRIGLGACLADDMGLGKTVELIAFLLREIENERDKNDSPKAHHQPSLLICPMSVAGNWQKELARFAPSLRVLLHHGQNRNIGPAFLQEAKGKDVVITTYALAQRDEEHLSAIAWSHVILDEAQNIKNQAARQTQSIKRLHSGQKIALTGTPVENRLSELWSIMDFLNPGYLGSFQSFRRDFALPIEKYKNKKSSEVLRAIIQPFVLRRLKTDPIVIQDLPEKMEMRVNYTLTAEQASLYAAVVEEMLSRIESLEGIERRGQILAALTKLKQICNHPALFLQDASDLDGRSGKLSRLEEMLYEVLAGGDSALIFTQYAAMGAMLRHHLQEKLGVEALFLHGGTTRKQRDDMVYRFQAGGSPIFILSLKAGGFGLNLTAASHVFHYDRWWNPAVENQATDRAFRIGQKKRVFVHKFVCLGTLEESIDRMIEEKKALAESVIGAGELWLTELSNEALRDMLSLRRDAVSSEDDDR
ncbi:MAG: ATP-dependent helicase HepA [Methanosaeta sp. PtaU1.Bin112]|nr:MAG: ATP-dependent helicase HepA [Methanosaeta sp. PtaU1.Bin112]